MNTPERIQMSAILVLCLLMSVNKAFGLENVPPTPAYNPTPLTTGSPESAPSAYKVTQPTGACEAIEKAYGWTDSRDVDFTKFKAVLSQLPPTLSVSPQSALSTMLGIQSVDSSVYYCKEDPQNKTKANIMISYVVGGAGYNTPTITVVSHEPDYEKQKPPQPKPPAGFAPMTPEQITKMKVQ